MLDQNSENNVAAVNPPSEKAKKEKRLKITGQKRPLETAALPPPKAIYVEPLVSAMQVANQYATLGALWFAIIGECQTQGPGCLNLSERCSPITEEMKTLAPAINKLKTSDLWQSIPQTLKESISSAEMIVPTSK